MTRFCISFNAVYLRPKTTRSCNNLFKIRRHLTTGISRNLHCQVILRHLQVSHHLTAGTVFTLHSTLRPEALSHLDFRALCPILITRTGQVEVGIVLIMIPTPGSTRNRSATTRTFTDRSLSELSNYIN